MIRVQELTKYFDRIAAVDHITAEIRQGIVFGLIGTNGAGKSTFLRLVSGILKPDHGKVSIDDQPVWENPQVKSRFFYISDDQFFFSNSTPREIMNYYSHFYPAFNRERFAGLMKSFGLDPNRKINTFSKGMKKQVSILCGICAGTQYILCDETFDGLDPVMRQTVKSLLAQDMAERQLTPIIASHNLRELEDICDHVGLLHKGGILLSKELDDLKLNLHKIQYVPGSQEKGCQPDGLDIVKQEQTGRLHVVTVRGRREEIVSAIEAMEPLFYELIPLSLEEIFISETEVAGYDIKSLIL